MLYECKACIITTASRADYMKHIKTAKHFKNTKQEAEYILSHTTPQCDTEPEPEPDPDGNIALNVCDILITRPSSSSSSSSSITDKPNICKICGACYSFVSGLSRHMKKCNNHLPASTAPIPAAATAAAPPDPNAYVSEFIKVILQQNDEIKQQKDEIKQQSDEYKQIITNMIKHNQEIVSSQEDKYNKVMELYKNIATSVTTNIYNHTGNNHFNLNVFLNEHCRDAMNMTDFVKSIEVTMEDVENVKKNGYVNGISSIFIDNLKNTDIHKRPIHCSDVKREVLYVKDADKWERECVDGEKMKNAVLAVEHKNVVLLNEWAKQHPECENSDSRANEMYLNMSKCVMDGDDAKILKVVKNIAKETIIERKNNSILEEIK